MTKRNEHTVLAAAVMTAMLVGLFGSGAAAQRVTPAEAATKLSGAWKINLELSPAFKPAPRPQAAIFPQSGAPSFAMSAVRSMGATTGFQRGGGRGGGAPAQADPAEMAGQAAIRSLQQVGDSMTITATADSVTFVDARGERTYVVNDKNTKINMGEAALTTKSKWERNSLKQEFVFGETKITHTWELNDAGTQLNFRMVIQNFSNTGPFREAKAVYDKV